MGPAPGQQPQHPLGRPLHQERQVGPQAVRGQRALRQDPGHHRAGPHRRAGVPARPGLLHAGHRLRPLHPRLAASSNLNVEKRETLEELLREADFITIHTPRTKETLNMIDDAADRPDEAGRAPGQLRPRRPLQRGGPVPRAQIGAHRLAGRRHLGARAPGAAILSTSSRPWSAPRTWAPPPTRPPSGWARRSWPRSSPACGARSSRTR